MQAKRPTPLMDVIVDRAYAGAVLLGRTCVPSAPTTSMKPLVVETAAPERASATPGAMLRLTPLGCISPLPSSRESLQSLQWACTPLATPSPWGARQLFHRDWKLVVPAASTDTIDADNDAESVGQEEEEEEQQQQQQQQQHCDDKRSCSSGAQRPPPGALHPSVGSERHAAGSCRACCFFPRGRCANGYACGFCHYEHEKRKRKSKKNVGKFALGVGKSSSALPLNMQSGTSLGRSFVVLPSVLGAGTAYSPLLMQGALQMTSWLQVLPSGQVVQLPMVAQQPVFAQNTMASTLQQGGLQLAYQTTHGMTQMMHAPQTFVTAPGMVLYQNPQ
mmetsp:Transcript_46436/g.132042  ORF Transcript_46436/g.132042 Transcript_46436/m.132042 type:complete len:333 (-) Transcript_46436:59-1057(-)